MSSTDGIREFEVHRDQLLLHSGGDALPRFTYHPDPVGTGSVAVSDTACVCCGRNRGWVYTGAVYAVQEIDDDELCPWCIADGSAAERFDATFNDVGNIDPWQQVSTHVVETISRRTPGFSGWQQERWLFHCNDGAQFIGPMGADELAGYPDAIESICEELSEFRWDAELVAEYLARLSKNGQPTAYVFRCRHCQTHVAYTDFT
ncbi:MAG TPA: hypothetical protein DGG94_06955 [Micromonosporaceae bacterium]|nr:hypothetical protein [Micromonosporaceae bacterium]HCU49526.1 hypothetical protein [Micromonosporaceae bacterium]